MTADTATATKLRHVARLVRAATGDEYGDGETVTEVGIGYAGGDPCAVWVAGDWNDTTRYVDADGDTPAHWETLDDTPSRLAAALERIGAEVEWLDEVHACHECGQCVRTEPNSYHWEPEYLIVDGTFLCGDCAREDAEALIAEHVNDHERAITSALLGDLDLTEYGFTRHPDGEHPDYCNGLHTGWNDNPATIADEIRERHGDDVDVLFVITGVQQFGLQFEAYYRPEGWQDED